MKLSSLLSGKGRSIVSISPDRTVLEAIQLLVRENIGSVLVLDDGQLVGILTERDVLRLAANRCKDVDVISVSDVMTKKLLTAAPDHRIGHAMELMTENRIRHLPILSDGNLVGIVSIGDVVNALRESVQSENRHLKQYIQGTAY